MPKIYLPIRSSKIKCLVLIGLLVLVYSIDSIYYILKLSFIISNQSYMYILKPSLFLGLAFIIWLYPRSRHKSKLRYKHSVTFWAFNFAVIYIVASMMAGLIDGLGKSPYNHSLTGIMLNILAVGSALVGRELVRAFLVNSLTKEENYLRFILLALFFSITSFSFDKYTGLKSLEDAVKFTAQFLAPEFSKNILATYLAFLAGPIASLIYMGTLEAFHWLSPILPNLQWITTALVGVLCPIFSLSAMQSIYLTETKALKERDKDEDSLLSWIITTSLSIAIIWFAVGVFPVYPSVIATGSMEPMIKPGDVILVDKVTSMEDINSLGQGDIIQFERDGVLISHRIIETIEEDGLKSYRTKGDNNSGPDVDPVKPEQIKGKVVKVVPQIGWPTLLIKSDKDIDLDKIVF